MKRRASSSSSSSPYSSSSSSSCSNSPSSSSSSCIESLMVQAKQALKPTPKARTRTRRSRTSRDTNSVASPKSRSSVYRGVTRHRWTGRFEAHLWDKSSWNNIQNKKGRQVYLGAYDIEEDAARTYDLAALKYWGPNTTLNFPVEMYVKEVKEMEKMTKEEYLNSLRRQSNGFSRGVSKYRGVARHHHNGRWEARIGRVCGNKYLYLGTFSTQEEAAEAYDKAALEYRGPNAVTNFNKNKYADMLKNIGISSDDTQLANEDTNCVPPLKRKESPPTTQDHDNLQTTVEPMLTCTSINLQSMPIMDPTEEVQEGHPWEWDDICLGLDTGFNDFPFFNFPMDQLPDVVFDYQGFDDNIDFIFDGPVNDTIMFLQDAFSGTDRCNVEGIALDVVNLPDASPSPSPSPCSSTTSVCSNM